MAATAFATLVTPIGHLRRIAVAATVVVISLIFIVAALTALGTSGDRSHPRTPPPASQEIASHQR
jgi:hypothetical protein